MRAYRRPVSSRGQRRAGAKRVFDTAGDALRGSEGVPFDRWLHSFGMDTEIVALRIDGSGYRTLTHRDFLGSLLGLGIERNVLGDLIVDSETGSWAILFCDRTIASFLKEELKKVANDKVAVRLITEWQLPPRRFAKLHDTVASPRLDCVVAALCGLSREKAQIAIRSEEVDVDYLTEYRVDRQIGEGSIITVRHKGKFILRSVGEQTKKGRYRLVADKYI